MEIRFGCNDPEFKKFKVYIYCDPRYSNNDEGYEYKFKKGILKLKNKPFYVGCARRNNHLRHLTGNRSSKLVCRRIKKIREEKLEPIIKILRIYKDRKRALKLEEFLIIGIGRQDLKIGPLLNKLDGCKNLSPKACKIRSEDKKRNWEDPEYRKKISIKRKKTWENPEYRKKISVKRKKVWENSEYRKKISVKIKEVWKNSEFRKKMNKKRSGEKNPNAKLTEKKVLRIRKLYKERNISQYKLAEKFKVSRSCIQYIIARQIWADI